MWSHQLLTRSGMEASSELCSEPVLFVPREVIILGLTLTRNIAVVVSYAYACVLPVPISAKRESS